MEDQRNEEGGGGRLAFCIVLPSFPFSRHIHISIEGIERSSLDGYLYRVAFAPLVCFIVFIDIFEEDCQQVSTTVVLSIFLSF